MQRSAIRIIAGVISCVLFGGCARAADHVVVLTYNIRHGQGADDRIDLERIAEVIKRAKPDIVALQEVDRKTIRSDRVHQAEQLANLTGMNMVFGPALGFQGGQYGIAILTRFTVLDSRIYRLPGPIFAEPRIALAADLQLSDNGPHLLFVNTHLDAGQSSAVRVEQMTRINDLFASQMPSEPVILAGDLNDTPDSRVLGVADRSWMDATASLKPTFPAEAPKEKIDYVLASPQYKWMVRSATVIDEETASDHRPVRVELEVQR